MLNFDLSDFHTHARLEGEPGAIRLEVRLPHYSLGLGEPRMLRAVATLWTIQSRIVLAVAVLGDGRRAAAVLAEPRDPELRQALQQWEQAGRLPVLVSHPNLEVRELDIPLHVDAWVHAGAPAGHQGVEKLDPYTTSRALEDAFRCTEMSWCLLKTGEAVESSLA